ncbi:MAG: dihydroorotate dehydrogenase electron transfer subunit, partial [Candidatus Omnitrophota bacterium]
MRKKQDKVLVLANTQIKGQYYKMAVDSKFISQRVLPGQFVMVKISEGGDILLRRPLSVHRVDEDKFELFYEVAGKGTEILSRRKAGDYIDVIGPLGNGFTCPRVSKRFVSQVLVAGGIGVAPLVLLAQRLSTNPGISSAGKITVLIGARVKQQVLCEKEFKKIGCEVKIATDDGSQGFCGRVTALLEKLLRTTNYQLYTIYACGPKPMLTEISRISCQYNISAQVSLEAHMACGIGACLGCVVNTKTGYKRVCQDGPVFRADEILW